MRPTDESLTEKLQRRRAQPRRLVIQAFWMLAPTCAFAFTHPRVHNVWLAAGLLTTCAVFILGVGVPLGLRAATRMKSDRPVQTDLDGRR